VQPGLVQYRRAEDVYPLAIRGSGGAEGAGASPTALWHCSACRSSRKLFVLPNIAAGTPEPEQAAEGEKTRRAASAGVGILRQQETPLIMRATNLESAGARWVVPSNRARPAVVTGSSPQTAKLVRATKHRSAFRSLVCSRECRWKGTQGSSPKGRPRWRRRNFAAGESTCLRFKCFFAVGSSLNTRTSSLITPFGSSTAHHRGQPLLSLSRRCHSRSISFFNIGDSSPSGYGL